MDNFDDFTPTQLGQGINRVLREQRAQRDNPAPLERPAAPAILADPKANPVQRAAAERQHADAERVYANELLQRKVLTSEEQRWLGSQINKAMRDGD
jgi:hypothetical protein